MRPPLRPDCVRCCGSWAWTVIPKTSGGRGLHVYVPIEPTATFIQARRAVIALGREVERRMPEQVTTSWWKEERGERIFIDFNQMARDRTMASAYSVRPEQPGHRVRAADLGRSAARSDRRTSTC